MHIYNYICNTCNYLYIIMYVCICVIFDISAFNEATETHIEKQGRIPVMWIEQMWKRL